MPPVPNSKGLHIYNELSTLWGNHMTKFGNYKIWPLITTIYWHPLYKFGNFQSKGSKYIELTLLGLQTNLPTDQQVQNNMPPFFKGGGGHKNKGNLLKERLHHVSLSSLSTSSASSIFSARCSLIWNPFSANSILLVNNSLQGTSPHRFQASTYPLISPGTAILFPPLKMKKKIQHFTFSFAWWSTNLICNIHLINYPPPLKTCEQSGVIVAHKYTCKHTHTYNYMYYIINIQFM